MKLRVTHKEGTWESDEISGMTMSALERECEEVAALQPTQEYQLVGGTEADRGAFLRIRYHDCFSPKLVLVALWNMAHDENMLVHYVLEAEDNNGMLDDDDELQRACEIAENDASSNWECDRPHYVVGVGATQAEADANCCRERQLYVLEAAGLHADLVNWNEARCYDPPEGRREGGGKFYAYDRAINPSDL